MVKILQKLIDQISELKVMEPDKVATLLGRRKRLLKEDGHHATFELVGGGGLPFDQVEIRWIKSKSAGILFLQVPSSPAIPIKELIAPWDHYPCAPMLPHLRDPAGMVTHCIRIPMGELRIPYYKAKDGLNYVHSIALDPFPILAWDKKRGS